MPAPTVSKPSFIANRVDPNGGLQDSGAVAALSDGRVVVAYRDQGVSQGALRFQVLNADGSVAIAERHLSVTDTNRLELGEISLAAVGNSFAAVWSSFPTGGQTDIRFRSFDGLGLAITGETIVNSDRVLGNQRRPDIAQGPGNSFLISYDDDVTPIDQGGVHLGVYVRGFGLNGVGQGASLRVSDTWGGDSSAAIATNRAHTEFNVVWDDSLGQSASTNGHDSIRGYRSPGVAYRVDSGAYQEFHGDVDVAYSTGNNFMAVWSEFLGSGRYAVYGAVNGGGEFQINTTPHINSTTVPTVVGLQSGNFVVFWCDGGFGGNTDILGQLYTAGGARIGGEFQVSDIPSNFTAKIDATETLDGRVLVSWDVLAFQQNDIRARFVDPRQSASVWTGTAAGEQYVGTRFNDVLDGAGGANRLWGEAGSDTLRGGAAGDLLDGGTGADTMRGLAGNDIYVVDTAGDVVDETAGGGVDTVRSSVSYSLVASARVKGAVENLTLTGAAAINGTGNGLNNVITGNGVANLLDGGAGADTLNGAGGNDILIGGAGRDVLTGGAGSDFFRINAPVTAANVDRITDFSGPSDTIQLDNAVMPGLGAAGALDAARFVRNMTGLAQDAADRVIYETDTGNVYYDPDGTGVAARMIIAVLSANLGVAAADFVVI